MDNANLDLETLTRSRERQYQLALLNQQYLKEYLDIMNSPDLATINLVRKIDDHWPR